jgi:cytochrome c biogenesis protein CcdA
MESIKAMEMPNENTHTSLPIKRTRWRWRLLFINVWLIAAFLLVVFFGLGVTAIMAGTRDELELEQRVYAFGAGALIIVTGLAILKALIPAKAFAVLLRKGK